MKLFFKKETTSNFGEWHLFDINQEGKGNQLVYHEFFQTWKVRTTHTHLDPKTHTKILEIV